MKQYIRFYSKDYCKEICSKCNNRRELSYNYSEIYGFLHRYHNDWLDEFLPSKKIKLTYERCYNDAKKCNTLKEFRENFHSSYQESSENGWISSFDWLKKNQKPSGYWNYETCYEEAKKYETISDFQKNCVIAYVVACRNGWRKDYTWLKHLEISEKNEYIVYCYIHENTNSAYVGLTKNIKRRHKQHHNGEKKHGVVYYDNVFNYFKNLGEEVPEPIILEFDIFAKDAQFYEEYYVDLFRKNGFSIINKTKTGSLGGGNKIWSYEKCMNESKKYKNRGEFSRKCPGGYDASKRNKWIDDWPWMKPSRKNPRGYWSYDRCKCEVEKYKSKKEFMDNSYTAYSKINKMKWYELFDFYNKAQLELNF